MSFNNTKSPNKPTDTSKQVYIVPMDNGKYYLTPELEDALCKLYPITMNPDLMEMFGLSFSTLHRFARTLGLVKNMEVIKKKHIAQIKRTCRKNGYYASLKGKRPSEACIEATRKRRKEGHHPLKDLKKKSPVKYRHLMKRKSEERKALLANERRRYNLTLMPLTNIPVHHYSGDIYTKREITVRERAKKFGYTLGDINPELGDRHNIYYDDTTTRHPIFESNVTKNDGFEFKHINAKRKLINV